MGLKLSLQLYERDTPFELAQCPSHAQLVYNTSEMQQICIIAKEIELPGEVSSL